MAPISNRLPVNLVPNQNLSLSCSARLKKIVETIRLAVIEFFRILRKWLCGAPAIVNPSVQAVNNSAPPAIRLPAGLMLPLPAQAPVAQVPPPLLRVPAMLPREFGPNLPPGEVRERLRQRLPHLHELVEHYKAGTVLKADVYLQLFANIMNELGFPNRGLDQFGNPEPLEMKEVMKRIQEKTGWGVQMRELFADELAAPQPMQKLHAFIEAGEGHFTTWIRREGTLFARCPEYLAVDGEVIQALPEAVLDWKDLRGKPLFAFGITYPFFNPGRARAFAGQMPNLNTCALESCVHLIAHLLAEN